VAASGTIESIDFARPECTRPRRRCIRSYWEEEIGVMAGRPPDKRGVAPTARRLGARTWPGCAVPGGTEVVRHDRRENAWPGMAAGVVRGCARVLFRFEATRVGRVIGPGTHGRLRRGLRCRAVAPDRVHASVSFAFAARPGTP